ncbi:MAG TPA: Holliday junction branch migration protein RuvA [Gammaproteobacteria bacterium]|nr:Holliday junction branch migration protein RuvA [Gammaproteobacteria bacterium]
MIGRLRGKLIAKHPPLLVLEVQGVGYEVEAPMTTFYKLPELDSDISLFTHLIVREDAHLLFGFATDRERGLFRSLLKVNGIGARTALAILSGMDADQFAACVQGGDLAQLTRIPGIGKKTAERLLVEMRDRLRDWELAAKASLAATSDAGEAHDAVADAVSALIALGYRPHEASRHVHAVAGAGMNSETLIREALKNVARASGG